MVAINRFMQKIIEIQVNNTKNTDDPTVFNKDWALVRTFKKYARPVPQHNLTNINLSEIKRKTKLALIIMPGWAVHLPPYGLAKLAGVTKAAGYQTTIYDINVKSWHYLKGKTESDVWVQDKDWMWNDRLTYLKVIHPKLEPLFNEYIEKIVEAKPDVIGFSIFHSNEIATGLFILKLKKLLPDVKIILGGPQVIDIGMLNKVLFTASDYVIQGEGEQNLVDLLGRIDAGEESKEKVIKSMVRLNLDGLPNSDYSQFDFNDYIVPNAINIEFTRGCVAKCVFCSETNYWKYRGRQSLSVLDEIKYLHETYGTDLVWFVDSLVNGNLNELRAFVLGVAEMQLPIQWVGQARCDNRMDADYFIDLARGGCKELMVGSESGSQQVLDLMKKNIKVADIEKNFRDASNAGISISSNWMMGFPNEEIQDVAKSFMLIGRVSPFQKNSGYNTGISALQITPGTELNDHKEKFQVSQEEYEGAWTTFDLANTKLHRLIREKTLLIFLNEICKRNNSEIYTVEIKLIADTYNIQYQSSHENYDTVYEDFDFNIIKPNINAIADSAVNEIWPLLWSTWKFFGAYDIDIIFDPALESMNFGRLTCDYHASYKFSIDAKGHWAADFKFNYNQKDKLTTDYSFVFDWKEKGQWK